MSRALLPVALCAGLLAACAHDLVLKSVCPAVKNYTAAEQAKLAAELGRLPPGSMLGQAIVDYERSRDAARACAKAAP